MSRSASGQQVFAKLPHPSLQRVIVICLLGLLFFLASCQSKKTFGEINLVVTTNLNGALDDCLCSPILVGGLTRISTIIARLIEQYPDAVVASAGDFLSSYSQLPNNRLMFKMMQRLPYHFIAIGDQEFVEGRSNLAQWISTGANNILLPFNLQVTEPSTFSTGEQIKFLEINGLSLAVLNAMSANTFDFIQPEGISCQDPVKAIRTAQHGMQSADIRILVWHGSWETAREFAEAFSWLDVILISHNQYRGFQQVGRTALIETGVGGEYVGRLAIKKDDLRTKFEYQFIPVTSDVPTDPELLTMVLALRDSINVANSH